MELEVQKSVRLEEGKRKGKIVGVEYREMDYKGEKITYADVQIEDAETGIVLKYGCSAYISEKSKLGKLLARFTKVTEGKIIDPEVVLKGKDVTFLAQEEKTDKGEFIRVSENSIKPDPVETDNFTSEDI